MGTATKTVNGKNGGTLKPTQKGEVRNPLGRPKGTKFLTQMLREEMDGDAEIIIEGIAMSAALAGQPVKVKVKMPTHKQIIQALLRKASKGDTKAIEMVFDRTEGKVALPLAGDPDQPLFPEPKTSLTPGQIEKLIEKL